MTLLLAVAALLASLFVGYLLAGTGAWVLRWLGVEEPPALALLYSVSLGVLALELCVSAGELLPNIRIGVLFAAGICCGVGALELPAVWRNIRSVLGTFWRREGWERRAGLALLLLLLVQGLAAMAPLTGSDALHYHFTIPAQMLRDGFYPNWFEPHSFFLGQTHQLILAALAAGSEQLAMGLLWLGGVAATIAIILLARNSAQGAWPILTAICFVLTPVVFWQISTAGAPDVWMAAFAPACVLATLRAVETKRTAYAVLAGALAGGLAGAKYTGIIFAFVALCSFAAETRVAVRSCWFFLSALVAGFWPYARNWAWTGDPVFPFLAQHFARQRFSAASIQLLLADTGASASHHVGQVLLFPFFAAVDQIHLGFWQMLGPAVLCFAPLLFFAAKNTPVWRITAVFWIGGALGIGLTSGMARFTLPLLPLALAAVLASLAKFQTSGYRIAAWIANAIFAAYLLIGAAGLLVYTRPALSAATGITSREEYLHRRAPDYYRSEFLNKALSQTDGNSRVLVTFGHTYYVRPPVMNAQQTENLLLDPVKLRDSAGLERFLRESQVKWVLKEGNDLPYPNELFQELEANGRLVPCGAAVVQDFSTNRINDTRSAESLTLLCLP